MEVKLFQLIRAAQLLGGGFYPNCLNRTRTMSINGSDPLHWICIIVYKSVSLLDLQGCILVIKFECQCPAGILTFQGFYYIWKKYKKTSLKYFFLSSSIKVILVKQKELRKKVLALLSKVTIVRNSEKTFKETFTQK